MFPKIMVKPQIIHSSRVFFHFFHHPFWRFSPVFGKIHVGKIPIKYGKFKLPLDFLGLWPGCYSHRIGTAHGKLSVFAVRKIGTCFVWNLGTCKYNKLFFLSLQANDALPETISLDISSLFLHEWLEDELVF